MTPAPTAPRPVRITLMGPDFFSYVQAIRDEFIKRGYPSSFADERHSNSVLAKIAYRMQWGSVLKRQSEQHLNDILQRIRTDGTTDVYLINTEVATPEFVSQLHALGARVHIYMWDSTSNKRSFLPLLPLMDGKSSFEPADCEKLGMRYIPLFAETMFSARLNPAQKREDQLVFLGTLHSRRATLIQQLEKAVQGSGLRIRKLLFYHSRLLYAVRCLAQPAAARYLAVLRTRSFGKAEIAQAYFQSRAVLDIHHPGQAGLTSRTFESLRSGAWLITLNPTVRSLPPELQERVVLLGNVNELPASLDKLRRELPPLSAEMDHFLSLERFADDLLDAGGLPRQALPDPR